MSFEEELVREINSLRTNPKQYVKKIKKYMSYFDGKLLKLPGSEASIETQEGTSAYQETIDFLSKQSPLDPFEPSKGLQRISRDFISEIQKINTDELDSIDLDKIIEKYGKFSGNLSRALDLGGETPEQVLVNLIVSDGDPSREQRESLLSKDLKKVGVGFGNHEEFKFVTVIVSCSKFVNNKDSNDNGYIDAGTKYRNPEKDDDPSKEVVSETRSEKVVMENGKKKKIIKVTRKLADGTTETETLIEKEED